MKIAVRFGHMKNCDLGALGIRPEYDLVREYGFYIISGLQKLGYEVYNVTPESANSMADSLMKGVSKANKLGCNYFISCHANFYDGKEHGSEVIYFTGSLEGKAVAEKINNELASIGFSNRGSHGDYIGIYELYSTRMTAVICEPFFCDSTLDMSIYNPENIGYAIVKGITGINPMYQLSTAFNRSIIKLQCILNQSGCRDENGNILEEDGVLGIHTRYAASNCLVIRGNCSKLVGWLQESLGCTVDFIYGQAPYCETYNSICDFQKKNNLKEDGVVGSKTWDAIINKIYYEDINKH